MRSVTCVKIIASVLLLCSNSFSIYSQVTVGSEGVPVQGALLQLKENENAAANSSKGLALPRVNLLSDTDVSSITGMAANPSGHVGLTVYHLKNGSSSLATGVYTWTGTKWIELTNVPLASSPWINQNDGAIAESGDQQISLYSTDISKGAASVAIGKQTVASGMALDVKGNTSIEGTATINGATAVTGNTTITGNTTVSGATETGTLRIKNAPTTGGNTQALTRNIITGEIELAADIPRKLAFFQSSVQTDIDKDQIRGGVVVPFATTDKLTNTLVKEPIANNEFELKEDAVIEISAYVCYTGGGVSYKTSENNNREIVVNATVQYCPKATGVWEDLSSVRGLYPNAVSYYINTLNIPPVMISGKQGDKIRIRLIQPPNTTKPTDVPPGGIAGYLGASHTAAKISVPYGTKYSKGIKIIVQ